MLIKNIVISDSGPTGSTTCGAISEILRQKIIDTNNIEKIYATSGLPCGTRSPFGRCERTVSEPETIQAPRCLAKSCLLRYATF